MPFRRRAKLCLGVGKHVLVACDLHLERCLTSSRHLSAEAMYPRGLLEAVDIVSASSDGELAGKPQQGPPVSRDHEVGHGNAQSPTTHHVVPTSFP